jgi:hypothetical protein
MYSDQELADMHLMYDLVDGNTVVVMPDLLVG